MKIHLSATYLPFKSGVDQKAMCGELVNDAEFPFILDLDYQHATRLNPLAICRKCLASRGEAAYVYGLVSGQDDKDFRKAVDEERFIANVHKTGT